MGPHTQRHAAVVLAATQALVQIHEGTLRGLHEVEILLRGSIPRALTNAILREKAALKAGQSVAADLQEIVERDERVATRSQLADRPSVGDLRSTSVVRASTSHLTAIRQWSLSERHRLRQATAVPAMHLVKMLCGEGREILAITVAGVWCAADPGLGGV